MPETIQNPPIGAADIEAAARVVAAFAVRTPLLSFPVLNERVGTKVFLKPEMLQRTGSFKFRGAFNKLASIPQDRRSGGVVEASLLKAPRNLNDPVRCSISGFRKTLVPTRSLRTGNDKSGVRTAKAATTLAAASISAAPIGGFWIVSGIRHLYRGRRQVGKTHSGDVRRRNAGLLP